MDGYKNLTFGGLRSIIHRLSRSFYNLFAKGGHSHKVPIYLVFSGYDYFGQSSILGLEENENGQISPRRKLLWKRKWILRLRT